ncbi:CG0192-related protein [Catellatospora methionotrophica]|uniref:CG0192-related protein n=1 Tax=Catellatospora methionotrophica TaxID=121620 RepID=UPI00341019AF
MALLYRAEIRPTKLELIGSWLPTRSWYQGPAEPGVRRVSACRFDDPDGEVGVETMLVQAGDGPVLHVPLTYRAAPLDGGEPWLVGTTEHSVLGERWVYDATGDPVYLQALATAILTGGGEAEEYVDGDGGPEQRTPAMTLRGSGTPGNTVPTVGPVEQTTDGDPGRIITGTVALTVHRVPGSVTGGPHVLTGTWDGGSPTVLAALTLR